ncbi:hypothetical protein DSECCO2_581470 [anaerobic digester metagenome]
MAGFGPHLAMGGHPVNEGYGSFDALWILVLLYRDCQGVRAGPCSLAAHDGRKRSSAKVQACSLFKRAGCPDTVEVESCVAEFEGIHGCIVVEFTGVDLVLVHQVLEPLQSLLAIGIVEIGSLGISGQQASALLGDHGHEQAGKGVCLVDAGGVVDGHAPFACGLFDLQRSVDELLGGLGNLGDSGLCHQVLVVVHDDWMDVERKAVKLAIEAAGIERSLLEVGEHRRAHIGVESQQ